MSLFSTRNRVCRIAIAFVHPRRDSRYGDKLAFYYCRTEQSIVPNPDYVIAKVRYDDDHSRITHVRRGSYDNDENVISPRSTQSRQTIVSSLNSGDDYYTVPPDGDGGFTWGDEVEVITIDGEDFIRTDGNEVKGDNLENLPEF